MAIISRSIQIKSKGENDIIDITNQTASEVKESRLQDGIVTVFVPGSTADCNYY